MRSIRPGNRARRGFNSHDDDGETLRSARQKDGKDGQDSEYQLGQV